MTGPTIEKENGIWARCRDLALETNAIATRLIDVCGARERAAGFNKEGSNILEKIEFTLSEIKMYLDEIDDQVSAIIERL